MAYCFYNGVKLPELPSTAYTYGWIRKNDNTQHYDLILTKVVGYYDATAGGIVYGANQGTTEIAHYRVAYASASTADSWDSYQTTNTWMALDANRTVMWSNHYIPNGSLTATEMYFDAHEAIPEVDAYQIEKETVVGIADQVRRLCNTEATMTPAVIKSNLEGLNIDLMETYVISGPEEQVIYPDEGYYGFSKITVGAVDTNEGDDDGETGGDTGDTGEEETGQKGNAEDLSFDLSVPNQFCWTHTVLNTSGNITDGYMQGYLFTVTKDFVANGARVYVLTTGVVTYLKLVDAETYSVLTEAKLPAASGTGWITYSFSPVRLYKDKKYYVFYGPNTSRYWKYANYGDTWNRSFSHYAIYNMDGVSTGSENIDFSSIGRANDFPIAIDLRTGDSTVDVTGDTYIIQYTTLELLANEVKRITGASEVKTVGEMVSLLQTVPAMTTTE